MLDHVVWTLHFKSRTVCASKLDSVLKEGTADVGEEKKKTYVLCKNQTSEVADIQVYHNVYIWNKYMLVPKWRE